MFRRKLFLGLFGLVAALAVAGWSWSNRGLAESDASLAVFNVSNLTCGSCVSNVQNALQQLDGVGAVEVSVTAGRSQVEYDSRLVDAEMIARSISEAGYPAVIRETLPAADYQALKAEEGRLANRYVARVGKRLLPRDEFRALLEQRKSSLPQPLTPESLGRLRLQVWNDLLQRELLLNSAEASNVVVQDGEVALEVERIKAGHAGFEQLISERYGSLTAFTRQIKNDMIIRKHLTENVAATALNETERQQQLQQWYQQLVETTPLVLFDPAIKAANSASGSGCGGSCCG